jgi:RimJ/RimL family protein N-acetyltransferase
MAWELTDDLDRFAADAGEFLRSRPVEHTVLLTLVDTLRRRGRHAYGSADPIFGLWRTAAGDVAGVFLQTPPHPMLFTAFPAGALAALTPFPLSGANLLSSDVDAFLAAWGGEAKVAMRTRLYRLSALVPPPSPPPGAPRAAVPADRDLVLRWSYAFLDDIGEVRRPLETPVAERITAGVVTLWEVDGTPVSMVVRSTPEAGMVRIQNVYTPPDRRGRGYAGAATAVATRAAFDAGATDVVLFTDQANPTSNALYQRLGYRPVEDRTVVEFAI